MMIATASNDELRNGQVRHWGLEEYYEKLAAELEITSTEASRNEWADNYYFWMYWGQWAATNDPTDLQELEHIIKSIFSLPGTRRTWDSSPVGKVLMDERFVQFVDRLLTEDDG
jgi:hypothetical protein